MTEDAIRNALSTIKYPGFSRDIVSFGLVKSISVENGIAVIGIQVQTRDPKVPEKIFKSGLTSRTPPARPTPQAEWLANNPSRG
jgi:hypothetical protein